MVNDEDLEQLLENKGLEGYVVAPRHKGYCIDKYNSAGNLEDRHAYFKTFNELLEYLQTDSGDSE